MDAHQNNILLKQNENVVMFFLYNSLCVCGGDDDDGVMRIG